MRLSKSVTQLVAHLSTMLYLSLGNIVQNEGDLDRVQDAAPEYLNVGGIVRNEGDLNVLPTLYGHHRRTEGTMLHAGAKKYGNVTLVDYDNVLSLGSDDLEKFNNIDREDRDKLHRNLTLRFDKESFCAANFKEKLYHLPKWESGISRGTQFRIARLSENNDVYVNAFERTWSSIIFRNISANAADSEDEASFHHWTPLVVNLWLRGIPSSNRTRITLALGIDNRPDELHRLRQDHGPGKLFKEFLDECPELESAAELFSAEPRTGQSGPEGSENCADEAIDFLGNNNFVMIKDLVRKALLQRQYHCDVGCYAVRGHGETIRKDGVEICPLQIVSILGTICNGGHFQEYGIKAGLFRQLGNDLNVTCTNTTDLDAKENEWRRYHRRVTQRIVGLEKETKRSVEKRIFGYQQTNTPLSAGWTTQTRIQDFTLNIFVWAEAVVLQIGLLAQIWTERAKTVMKDENQRLEIHQKRKGRREILPRVVFMVVILGAAAVPLSLALSNEISVQYDVYGDVVVSSKARIECYDAFGNANKSAGPCATYDVASSTILQRWHSTSLLTQHIIACSVLLGCSLVVACLWCIELVKPTFIGNNISCSPGGDVTNNSYYRIHCTPQERGTEDEKTLAAVFDVFKKIDPERSDSDDRLVSTA